MRKKYLIFAWLGPYDGWVENNYEGYDTLEEAQTSYNMLKEINNNDPLILVEVLRDNGIETEYK